MINANIVLANTSATSENIVDVRGLCVEFNGFFAVRNVSFNVRNGEIFGFLGANGAGKTTTIRVICGLLSATSGEVFVDGEHFVRGKEDIIKSKVGYMSQRFTLYDDLTIRENLEFAGTIRGVSAAKIRQRKNELFDLIQLDRKESCLIAELPCGVKQQVALVASLIHDPKLIVLDEPTAGVSPASRAFFWELIKKLTGFGKTVFVTTHYMDEAENCDRVALMRSGELIALGTVAELKQQTFQKQMYNVTPKTPLSHESIEALAARCSLFEPCGIHYHVIPNSDEDLAAFEDVALVEPVLPSLEDVFIQLVEGNR
jgi:ABC-2 type transport system ATP-binding protein